jgi:hypothetical protein
VEEAFTYVLFGTVTIAAIVAVLSLRGERYDHIGRGGLFDDAPRRAPAPTPVAVRDDEIRQMLGARNARRASRGEPPLDVEDELARLTRPSADPALEAEIRVLVEVRNARRVRRGEPPLDVEVEIRRHLRDAMG